MDIQESPAVLFVQSMPSQLDGPFYSCLASITSNFGVVLLNGSKYVRHEVDPELGFIPKFPDNPCDYPIATLPSEQLGGIETAIRLIRQIKPRRVVIQDQSWRGKIRLMRACRRFGIPAFIRSDKNSISETARAGLGRMLETLVFKAMVKYLAPVSELTLDYYRWSRRGNVWKFPYPSSRKKFAPNDDSQMHRFRLRESLHLSTDATVFLVVAKFVDRENVQAAVKSFAKAAGAGIDMALLVVGAGKQETELRGLVQHLGMTDKVRFVGYVPYVQLQNYFWASDVFVHLARCEPWGASAQDALVARMALITSNKVGAGVCHLTGKLSRFVVGSDDIDAASAAMLAIASGEVTAGEFQQAWDAVDAAYTAEALAQYWASRLRELPCRGVKE